MGEKTKNAKDMLLGVFPDKDDAENAINELRDDGYNPKDISVIMKDTREGKEIAENTGAKVAGSTAKGAVAGGVIGGLAGLLIGVGAIAIPGIGAVLIGGPIAAALGLSGAAATTVSGAATGVLAGGIAGALVGIGIAKEDAQLYEERIKSGGILVAVPLRANDMKAEDILRRNHADQVKTFPITGKTTLAGERISEGHGTVNPVQVQKYLKGIEYPASKEEIVRHAKDEGADRNVIDTLEGMPRETYDSVKDVSRAIGAEE